MNKTAMFSIAVFAVASSGCASKLIEPNPLPKTSYTQVIKADYDKTWTALIDAASEDIFAVKNFEKESGLLTFEFAGSAAGFSDCGSYEKGGTKHTKTLPGLSTTGVANVSLRPMKSGTRVRVNARMVASAREGGSFRFGTTETAQYRQDQGFVIIQMTCTSNGYIESKILKAVQARVR